MEKFICFFNSHKFRKLPALERAGVAHTYFESIHPFEDGNGRIGRCLVEKSLSQSIGRPTLISLAKTIEQSRKGYYSALQSANQTLHIQNWLEYFCKTCVKAQRMSQSYIDFLINKAKFYDQFASSLNLRQEKVVKRIFKEGPDGFEGGLSAENYIAITKTSRATATRDLQKLVEIGAFNRSGERKHTRYSLRLF